MSQNMEILKTMLHSWSDEEVSKAWSLIAEEGNKRRAMTTKNMRSKLREGDIVSFSGRKSGSVTGTIVRVKRKKAIVSVPPGRNWDVPLSMLKKVN